MTRRNITSALAQQAVGSQFDLVLIASNRVRELRHCGSEPRVEPLETDVSTVLHEIELGLTGREYLTKNIQLPERMARSRR
jgi:DNA-directed RNA polymerase subunit K/omega